MDGRASRGVTPAVTLPCNAYAAVKIKVDEGRCRARRVEPAPTDAASRSRKGTASRCVSGFVSRHSTAETDDGLPGDEGQFLACSFWLVSALARNGRAEEARALLERLIALSNDLGLLAEEYDVGRRRQVGNSPRRAATSP